jgi:hypothetical protein
MEIAAAFTPTGNYSLTQIDVAILFIGPPDTNGFTLSLNQDSGSDAPGTAIATLTGLFAPNYQLGTSSLVDTDSPSSNVVLQTGVQYWIVASPAASNTYDGWSLNAINGTGPAGVWEQNAGSGWVPGGSSASDLAFDVQGSLQDPADTPEPGTFMLIPSALIGLSLIRKLRRS